MGTIRTSGNGPAVPEDQGEWENPSGYEEKVPAPAFRGSLGAGAALVIRIDHTRRARTGKPGRGPLTSPDGRTGTVL